jgi:hypothetical protein
MIIDTVQYDSYDVLSSIKGTRYSVIIILFLYNKLDQSLFFPL